MAFDTPAAATAMATTAAAATAATATAETAAVRNLLISGLVFAVAQPNIGSRVGPELQQRWRLCQPKMTAAVTATKALQNNQQKRSRIKTEYQCQVAIQ